MCYIKKVFLKKAPVLESLTNKVGGMKACNVIKKRLLYRFFLVNIAKFLRRQFRRLSTTSESKTKFVQSMQIV